MLYTISKCLNIRSKALLIVLTVMLIGAGCASTKPGSVVASGSADTRVDRTITGISTSDEPGAVKIKISGNSPLRYTSVKQDSPLGIVLYFPETKLKDVQSDYPVQSDFLSSVKTAQQDHASGSDSRVKILLAKDVDYDVVREGNDLFITLGQTEDLVASDSPAVTETDADPAKDATLATANSVDPDESLAKVETVKSSESVDEVKPVPVTSGEDAPDVAEPVDDAVNTVIAENETNPAETPEVADAAPAPVADSNPVATVTDPESEKTEADSVPAPAVEPEPVAVVSAPEPVKDTSVTTPEPVVAATSEPGKNATKLITVSKMVKDDRVVVDIKADGKIDDYKIFTIPADKKNAARIVCDIFKLNGIRTKGEEKIAVNSKGVTQVRYCSFPEKTRVVVDTNDDNLKAYNANAYAQGLEIQIGSRLVADASTSAEESHETPVPVEVYADNGADTQETVAVKETMVEKETVKDGKNWVKRVDFTSEKNGKSSFIIETAQAVKYTTNKKNSKTLHVRLYDTQLPKSRKYPFITTRFDSAVNRIIPVQTRRMKDNALFIIELRQAVPFNVDQQGDVIRINFDRSTVAPKPEGKAGLAPWKQVLSQTSEIRDIEIEASGADSGSPVSSGKAVELRAGSTSEPVRDLDSGEIKAYGAGSRSSMDSKSSSSLYRAEPLDTRTADPGFSSWAPKKRYTGEKISVDFFETDIKNVFRIIRAVSGQNFAIDKDVTGKVTMTLDKPVPWDQVLDLVLKMNMLGMTTEGGINRIATLDTLKQEEEKRLEYIAAEEKTKLKKKELEPLSTEYILINYSNAEKEIIPHIEKLLTKDRGKVSVDVRTNQIILTDTKVVIDQARSLIRKLDKITPQVVIEARIVEATTTFSRNLGTEWGINSNPNYDIYNDTLGGTYGYAVAMNNSVAADSSIGINFTKLTNAQFLLNAKLMAMESKGEGKIISAPKVLTMDNKEATIIQGVEVPFSTVSSEGTQTTFKKIELKLTVTPHVTADNKISLKVLIDKNDIGTVTDIGPTITTKKVESELLISDGDTIVIGGIIKSNKAITEKGFPLLQHIPVLGWLFKSRIQSEDKQELLVFLSPRIVSYEETER